MSSIKSSTIEKFSKILEEHCKRDKVLSMKGIKETLEDTSESFKNIPDDAFFNLYMEVCALYVDSQAENSQFPQLNLSSVLDVLSYTG